MVQSEDSEDTSRKDAKGAKFGEYILTADFRRLSRIKFHSPQRAQRTQRMVFLCLSGDDDKHKNTLLRTISGVKSLQEYLTADLRRLGNSVAHGAKRKALRH